MYEYRIDIAGVEYRSHQDYLMSVNIKRQLFDSLSVGNAFAAELTVSLIPKNEVPENARIVPYCRKIGSESWDQLGEFYVDTRTKSGDELQLVAYDRMLRSEKVWNPRQDLQFPTTMEMAAVEIASLMGTKLDSRCRFNDAYTIDYPADKTYRRDILRYIAAAHGGNWIITNAGELLLVPLFDSMPPETNYLVTENGRAIVLGKTRILI